MYYGHGFNEDYAFASRLYKNEVLFKEKNYYSDKLVLEYQSRRLDYTGLEQSFQNYALKYSLWKYKIGNFYVGYDFLKMQDSDKKGGILGIGKQFDSIEIYPYAEINYYSPTFYNYEVGISKSFHLNTKLISYVDTFVYYEKLFDFDGFNFSVSVPLNL